MAVEAISKAASSRGVFWDISAAEGKQRKRYFEFYCLPVNT